MGDNLEAINEQLELDLEDAEIKPYFRVNQSNELINARQDLTLTERRIIYSLVSLVQPEDNDFKTYVLQIKELANLIGIVESSFYNRVEKAVDGLQSKHFVIEEADSNGNKKNDTIHKINWIQQASYVKGEGIIIIKLSDTLAKYLINLKKYTGYQLFNVLQLKSEYSWRLYELLKEREPWNKRVIKVKELRNLLGIPDDKIKLMKNFRTVVLDKAKKEIGEKTDIRFEYEVHKRVGRSIDSFIFYIYKNNQNNDNHLTSDAIGYDVKTLLNRLIANGVRREKATNYIKTYHPRYIEDNINYVMQGNEGIGNIAGYIVKAIEANYAGSLHEMEEDNNNSLIRLMVGNYDNKLKEITETHIAELEQIYDYFLNVIQKENPSTDKELKVLSEERERRIYDKIDQIQELRQHKKLPQLTIDDVSHSKVKMFFNQWLALESQELPY